MTNHKFIISVLTLGFLVFSYSAFAKPGPHGPRGGGFNKPGFNKPHGGFNKPGPNHGPMNRPGMHNAKLDPKADQNHDGFLDKKELHQGKIVKYDNNNNGFLDPAEKKYMHTDKNHDGKVGPVEKKFAENHQPTPEEHQNFVEQADTDDNGVLSPSEIQTGKSKVNTQWEKSLDTDGDGYVSGDEVKAFKAEHPDFKIPGKHPHKPHNPSFNPELMDPSETGIGAVLDTLDTEEVE